MLSRRALLLGTVSLGLVTRPVVAEPPDLVQVNRLHPLARGLVSWWLAVPSQTSRGTVWADLMGLNRGTVTGVAFAGSATSGWGATRRRGGFGELRFDGAGDYVQLASRRAFPLGTGALWTLAAWVRPGLLPGTGQFLACYGTVAGAGTTPNLAIAGGNGRWRVSGYGTGCDLDSPTTTAVVGTWTHLLGGIDPANGLSLYVNGRLVAGPFTAAANAPANAGGFLGGASSSVALFTGALDDVRLYRRTFGPGEALALYYNSLDGYPGLLLRRGPRHLLSAPLVAPVGQRFHMGD